MVSLFKFLRAIFSPEKAFRESLKNLLGFYPENLSLYKQAFRHSSIANSVRDGIKDSNERLEFLGDAILGAVISNFLFKTFPYKDEGFLTKMRSKIVSRYSLNQLGIKFGLNLLVQKSADKFERENSITGDALEALIGAVYLDKGYDEVQKFILNRIIKNNIDLEELENKEIDFKSKLIEWGQKEKKKLNFSLVREIGTGNEKQFHIEVIINEVVYAEATHLSKKRAEQIAAEYACQKLQL